MNRYPNATNCPDCSESIDTDCPDCGGYGTIANPIVDMRHLRDCIAGHGVAADLYMSGGNVATIGIGGIVPATDDPYAFGGDFAYLVGPGYYPDGTAHRDELSAGADDYYHVATPNLPNGSPGYPYDPYNVCIADDETVEAFAGRIAAQYAALTRDHHRDPITAIAGNNGTVCVIIPAADVDRIITALDVIRQDDDTTDDAERAAVVRAADDAHRAITHATADAPQVDREWLASIIAEDDPANGGHGLLTLPATTHATATHCGWRHCADCNDADGNPTRTTTGHAKSAACSVTATRTT